MQPWPRQPLVPARVHRQFVLASWALLLAACGHSPPIPPSTQTAEPPPAVAAKANGEVLAQSSRFIIYDPEAGDSLRSIAARFLGDPKRDWVIGDFNGISQPVPGRPLVVPLKTLNPLGIYADQMQSVPILCYHRFGPTAGKVSAGLGKMTVSAANFAAQLDWLARNDYHVIRLSQLLSYLEGREALPKRTVVITIDDGYESVHRHAFPLLKKYGFPATVFMYTDFIGAKDALSWSQLEELSASGLVDIQAHSKTHRNLIERTAGDSDERYKQILDAEVRVPRDLLERRLSTRVQQYAFPFGDANEAVLEALARNQYKLAVTVNPGGNPFFAQPLMLRRTMIYGDHDLAAFQAKLQISRPISSTAP